MTIIRICRFCQQKQSPNIGIIGAEIGAYSSKISLATVAMLKVEYRNNYRMVKGMVAPPNCLYYVAPEKSIYSNKQSLH